MDRPEHSGGPCAGVDSRAMELPTRPFSAAGKLARDHIDGAAFERLKSRVVEEMNRDAFLGAVTKFTTTEKAATFTLPELQRTVAICEQIQRQQPFQRSHFMADDFPHLVKCEGKYYMGLHKWHEFNRATYAGESHAIKWLLEQKVLDLDAAAKP